MSVQHRKDSIRGMRLERLGNHRPTTGNTFNRYPPGRKQHYAPEGAGNPAALRLEQR